MVYGWNQPSEPKKYDFFNQKFQKPTYWTDPNSSQIVGFTLYIRVHCPVAPCLFWVVSQHKWRHQVKRIVHETDLWEPWGKDGRLPAKRLEIHISTLQLHQCFLHSLPLEQTRKNRSRKRIVGGQRGGKIHKTKGIRLYLQQFILLQERIFW